MMSILYMIIEWVFSILPDSPFQSVVDGIVYEVDFLPQLNWFVPFDTCGDIFIVWLDCIVVYYVFVLVKKVVMDYLINIFMSAASVVGKGITSA